jgi:hypothetical protein
MAASAITNIITVAALVGWINSTQAQDLAKALTALIGATQVIVLNSVLVWKYLSGRQALRAKIVDAKYRYMEIIAASEAWFDRPGLLLMTDKELQERIESSPALRHLRGQLYDELSFKADTSVKFDPFLILAIISLCIQLFEYCNTEDSKKIKQAIRDIRSTPPRKLMRLRAG